MGRIVLICPAAPGCVEQAFSGGRLQLWLRLAAVHPDAFHAVNRRTEVGAVAQLGERVNGIDEVGGSNPPSSTKNLYGRRLFRLGAR